MNIMLEIKCSVPSLATWVLWSSPVDLSPSPCIRSILGSSNPAVISTSQFSQRIMLFDATELGTFCFLCAGGSFLPRLFPHPISTHSSGLCLDFTSSRKPFLSPRFSKVPCLVALFSFKVFISTAISSLWNYLIFAFLDRLQASG